MPASAKEYQRVWEENNRDKRRVINRRWRTNMLEWYHNLKSSLACERCGFSNTYALHFHHKNPAHKVLAVGEMMGRKWGKDRILSEIAKCEVLCANCHATETHASKAY